MVAKPLLCINRQNCAVKHSWQNTCLCSGCHFSQQWESTTRMFSSAWIWSFLLLLNMASGSFWHSLTMRTRTEECSGTISLAWLFALWKTVHRGFQTIAALLDGFDNCMLVVAGMLTKSKEMGTQRSCFTQTTGWSKPTRMWVFACLTILTCRSFYNYLASLHSVLSVFRGAIKTLCACVLQLAYDHVCFSLDSMCKCSSVGWTPSTEFCMQTMQPSLHGRWVNQLTVHFASFASFS